MLVALPEKQRHRKGTQSVVLPREKRLGYPNEAGSPLSGQGHYLTVIDQAENDDLHYTWLSRAHTLARMILFNSSSPFETVRNWLSRGTKEKRLI